MFSLQSVRTGDMCKWCVLCILGFSFIRCLRGEFSSLTDFDEEYFNVHETEDAVVIEAFPLERQVFLQGRPRSVAQNVTNLHRTKRQIPWQTLLSGPCITSQGKLGKCTSFRVCYPYFKLPDLNNWESWVLGLYDTCSYFTENGEQAFGVCCTNPNAGLPKPPQATTEVIVSTSPATTSTATTSKPVDQSTLNPIPPNWPPPIPTHPPNHTIPPLPTHPPSPGYPTTRPTRPSPTTSPESPPTQKPTTQRPTRPTFTTQRPTRPTFTTQRPTRPTFTTQRPTRPTFTTQRPTRPTFTTSWPTHPTFTTQRPTIPTAPPLPTRPTTKWPPTHPPLKPIGPPAPPENEIFDGTCGAKNGYQDQERIVGGQTADVNEWPWVAVLFNGGRQFCGGSLIDHEHILSAAHCVAHMSSWDVARVTVRLGDHNIRISTETKHVEKRLKRIVRHRGFDPRTLYNDVAVLTLDSPVTFSRTIRPICLPSGSQNYAGLRATVIGWGSLRESGSQPAELQEVSIPIWTNQDCRLKYGLAAPGGIVEHFLCAGQPSRDSCSGDSGGPLMVSQGKRWTQVGIVSWGIGCGKGQYPGVYTRVTHFMPWIIKNLK